MDIDGGPGQAGEAEGLKNGTVGEGGLACVSGDYDPKWHRGPGGGLLGDGKCCNGVSCRGNEGKSFLNGGADGSSRGGFGGGVDGSNGMVGGGSGFSGGSVIASYNPFLTTI